MTPEQTLDWLAQQHWDQCRENRPIQDWIRKMKSELPQNNTVEAIKMVLKGIDQTETESPDGWWETSVGAKFGAKKLKYVIGLLAQPEICKYGQEPKSCTSSPMDCQCALDATFAQSEQEPVAWELGAEVYWGDSPELSDYVRKEGTPLYTTPPPRTWVELTDEEINEWTPEIHAVIRTIEAKLKEKNT